MDIGEERERIVVEPVHAPVPTPRREPEDHPAPETPRPERPAPESLPA